MPLRDHFHGILKDRRHWESFHSLWPGMMVKQLNPQLPRRYYAEPHAHLGIQVEVDLATFEEETPSLSEVGTGDGVATAVWVAPRATQTFLTDLPAQSAFGIRVYDEERASRLVAAVELVSPANKDRPEHRRAFLLKCAGYLREGVSLVIVDAVTERHQNLHTELMQLLQLTETPPWPEDTPLYAVAYRTTRQNEQWQMEIWKEVLALRAPLPTLPLWLAGNLTVPLELEPSYEETCAILRIS